MATTPITLDRPPGQPPNVTAQQGGAPPMDVASAIGGGPSPAASTGASGPKGQFVGQCDAIRRMIQMTAQMEPAYAPYADKMLALNDAGMAAAQSGAAPGGGPNPGDNAAEQTAGAPGPPSPPPVGSPFPG